MKFDTSEMKSLNECPRKWFLSSRNSFHLRPTVTRDVFAFGTLFHEALHALYLGGNVDKIIEQATRELSHDETQVRVMRAMLSGYADVASADMEKYHIVDIERSVNFYLKDHIVVDKDTGEIDDEASVIVRGSIDMIAYDKETFEVFGFEHKSAKKFRDPVYLMVDEQPRVYTIELLKVVAELNHTYLRDNPGATSGPFTYGGIFINQVKKVQRTFEYNRFLCKYSDIQIEKFERQLNSFAKKLKMYISGELPCDPMSSYMGCSMCDFGTICETYGHDELDMEEVLDEFVEEFKVREHDHLEEKVERNFDTGDNKVE